MTLERTPFLFFCNGGVDTNLPSEGGTPARIDGSIAYGPLEIEKIEKDAGAKAPYAGRATVTITSKSFNEANGQTTYTELVPFVRCAPEANVQPTETSCSSFALTGVSLERTWTTSNELKVISMLDVWRSTDGKAHEVAVNYRNEFEQEEVGGLGAFEFPGSSAFVGTTALETIALPSGPGTLLYQYDSATPEAGNGFDPQGAIVYDRAPSAPLVVTTPTSAMQREDIYEAPYKFALPAGGASVLRMTFVTGYGLPEVRSEAAAAVAGYAPTISLAAPANGASIETESPTVAVAGSAADSGALTGVTVNGTPATLGAGGAFSAAVTLKPGANTITAIATDQAGLTTERLGHGHLQDPARQGVARGRHHDQQGPGDIHARLQGRGRRELRGEGQPRHDRAAQALADHRSAGADHDQAAHRRSGHADARRGQAAEGDAQAQRHRQDAARAVPQTPRPPHRDRRGRAEGDDSDLKEPHDPPARQAQAQTLTQGAAVRSLPCRAVLLAAFTICALALSTASASALVDESQITTPAGTTYPLSNSNIAEAGTPITISGTANFAEVDVRCYYAAGGGSSTYFALAEPVAVVAGSFSVAVPRIDFGADEPELCRLRAVPVGANPSLPPGEEGSFAGPLVAPSNFSFQTNAYEATSDSLSGSFYAQAADACGLESHLIDPTTLESTANLFYCDGKVLDRPSETTAGEKETNAHIDGAPVYSPKVSESVEKAVVPVSSPMPGAQKLAIVSKSFNESDGDMSITEQDPFVKCAPETLELPTKSSCTSFASAGVTLERTWTFGDADHIAAMLDVWRSTDGKAHKVEFDYYNEFNQANKAGAYDFPGTAGFAGTSENETIALPAGPGTILYKYDRATSEAGNGEEPQGAIVYDRAPTGALKVTTPSTAGVEGVYDAPYTLSVPASGTSDIRMTYIQGFGLPEIQSEAGAALAGYAPTISLAAPVNGATIETESSNVAVAGAAADSGALASVTVNGSPVTLGAGGSLTSVPLVPGTNTITATATDQAGLTKSTSVSVTRKLPPAKAALVGAITTSKGNVSFELACKGAQGTFCSVKDSLSTLERRRKSKIIGLLARITKKQVTVSSGTQVILPGKEMKVTLKLNSTGKALLKQFHKLPVHLAVTIAGTPKATIALARNLAGHPAGQTEET